MENSRQTPENLRKKNYTLLVLLLLLFGMLYGLSFIKFGEGVYKQKESGTIITYGHEAE